MEVGGNFVSAEHRCPAARLARDPNVRTVADAIMHRPKDDRAHKERMTNVSRFGKRNYCQRRRAMGRTDDGATMAKRKELVVAPVPPAPPSARKAAAIDAAKARVQGRTERVSIKVASAEGTVVGITAPHTDEAGQHYHLLDTFGTTSSDFMGVTFSQLLESLRDANGSPNEMTLNAALAIVGGLEPSNEMEALLASQMAATHSLAMKLIGRTRRVDQLNQTAVNGGLAVKLLRTFTLQAETLAKLRRGGGQTVRVEHVHVHPGGQAIVGNVAAGGGLPMKSEDQPHAKPAAALTHADAPFDPLRSAHAERDHVPVARDA